MKPQDFKISELIENLRGTCSSIDENLPEGMDWEDLTTEDHEIIDANIFKCETCSWWFDQGEQGDDNDTDEEVCKECIETDN